MHTETWNHSSPFPSSRKLLFLVTFTDKLGNYGCHILLKSYSRDVLESIYCSFSQNIDCHQNKHFQRKQQKVFFFSILIFLFHISKVSLMTFILSFFAWQHSLFCMTKCAYNWIICAVLIISDSTEMIINGGQSKTFVLSITVLLQFMKPACGKQKIRRSVI